MKYIVIAFILFSFLSCEKNPFWVGKKEHLTFTYSYSSEVLGPDISSYAVDESPFVSFEDVNAVDLMNGTVRITVSGIRVQSNRNNFEITDISVFEKDDKKFENQDEFLNDSSSYKNDIAAVLVLDMSTSLEAEMDKLKTYAKNFVDKVVNSTGNSVVAVVFFNGKDNITSTGFYNYTNAPQLKSLIDDYVDYQPRTALFQATLEGISLLDNLLFDGPKTLVVFTDGGDNDTDNPDQALTEIKASSYYRISIGLEGEDFDKEDITSIATSKRDRIIAQEAEDLERIFENVAKQVSSVYEVVYERSDQLLSSEIKIKFEFSTKKIE